MSPQSKSELARAHLDRALRAMTEGDDAATVTFLHLSAEAAIVALAEQAGIATEKRHDKKAQAARRLYEENVVSEDLSETLRTLNQARKDLTYEGDDLDLGEEELAEIAARIERVVETAERSS